MSKWGVKLVGFPLQPWILSQLSRQSYSIFDMGNITMFKIDKRSREAIFNVFKDSKPLFAHWL